MSGSLNVEAGNRLMDRISKELGLSECGKAWCTAALDPYHDTPIDNLNGYPDINEAPSVIQVVKNTYTIAVPGGVAGNWDCHIASMPWLIAPGSSFDATAYVPGLFTVNSTNVNQITLGGLMFDAVASGNRTFDPFTTSPTNLDDASNSTYCINEWRQIAHGFEVINTTSELNVQGLVTCYRQAWPARDTKSSTTFFNYVTTGAGAVIVGTVDTVVGPAPPQNLAAAMLLPGSVQWKAKEGAYVVPTLNSNDLPAGNDNTIPLVRFANYTVGPFAYGTTLTPNVTIPPTGGSGFQFVYPTEIALSDFNTGGAYFSGLSNSSTLTVNVIRYFERFPVVNIASDSALVVLGRPSCRNDPQAQELYSAVIRHMPVGVPQRFNGIGDWFKEAVQTARDIVAPVLSAIPHPLAMIGSGILKGVAGNIDKKYSTEEKSVVVPPGKTYSAQGTQSLVKRSVPSVAKQLATLKIGAKKKKTGVSKKTPKKS